MRRHSGTAHGRPGAPIRAALIGAGEFGTTLLAQVRRLPGLSVPVVCDRDIERAAAAVRAAGHCDDEILRLAPGQRPAEAIAPGRVLLLDDADGLAGLPLDIVVEATGQPEAGARHALAAFEAGRHVAMVTKEVHITVGPILARRARQAGLTYTLVDGDQPNLLIALLDRVRRLGLPLVAAGKATEYDVVVEPDLSGARSLDRDLGVALPAGLWSLEPGRLAETLAARAEALRGAYLQTVPDLCEMGIVANATGLSPDCPQLHAPIARSGELPEIFRPAAEGGLLRRAGAVDAFVCLRRSDELGFAGGVFAVVACPDADVGRLFAAKGLPVSRDGHHLMLHNPDHLLGAEAPLSIMAACAGEAWPLDRAPGFDLVAETATALPAGHVLGLGERHALDGTAPRLLPAAPLGPAAPLPYYLAPGSVLRRALPAGAPIALGDVELAPGSTLLSLRREQDETFPTASGAEGIA